MSVIVNLGINVPHNIVVKDNDGDPLPDQDAVSWTLTHPELLQIKRSGAGWDLVGLANGVCFVQMTATAPALIGGSFMAVIGQVTGLTI